MTRGEWLTLIMREANGFVNEHEAELKRAVATGGGIGTLAGKIDRHVRQVLLDVDDLWHIIRHSGLREPDPALWQDAESWSRVVVGVAFACLAHDLARNVEAIVKGELPRIDPAQVTFLLEKGDAEKA